VRNSKLAVGLHSYFRSPTFTLLIFEDVCQAKEVRVNFHTREATPSPYGHREILESERGSTRPHFVEKSFWKKLWTCRKTEYGKQEAALAICIAKKVDHKLILHGV
jgi:hypothetical protein